jgi:hypothetical protein
MFSRYNESAKQAISLAREEASNLGSSWIESEHLLLGTRQTISILSRSRAGDNVEAGSSPIGFTWTAKRRYWIATLTHLAPLIILGVGVVESTVTGRHLVMIGALWLLVALAWQILGPSSFFWGLGKRNRSVAITISYAFFLLFHLFMFGWLIPLGIGIYRVIVGL